MEESSQQIEVEVEENKPKHLDETYRFLFKDQDAWRTHLAEEGFVVIANWLSDELCQKYVDQLWGIMEKLSLGRLNKNDLSTQILSDNYPPLLHGGMIQYIGHSKPQWELRKICKPLFQTLWKTQDVRTSFDGFCFMNGRQKFEKMDTKANLHSDQSPTKNFVWSYQGIMTLTDAGPDGGGFVAIPRSHLYHRQYFEEKKLLNKKENWHMFSEADKVKEPICNDLKVNTKAGDFILFDSRTFHCNTKPSTETLRVCTYICMIPSTRIPQRFQQGRIKAVHEKRNSNHHAGDGFRTFPAIPRNLNGDPQQFKKLVNQVNDFDCKNDPECRALI